MNPLLEVVAEIVTALFHPFSTERNRVDRSIVGKSPEEESSQRFGRRAAYVLLTAAVLAWLWQHWRF